MKTNLNKIYGVVVLYNPSIEVLSNIYSYLSCLDKLYAIDNSEKQNLELVSKLKHIKKIKYIWNVKNLGIGYALNLAANKAINEGVNWLLTMDQDSRFEEDGISKLIKFINDIDTSNIAIVSPFHWTSKDGARPNNKNIQESLTVMTSGNLLNLAIFEKVGIFKEEYFIDYIDHEYCLRLQKNKYKVVVHNGVILRHKVGTITYHLKFIKTTNHNAIRRYYITRNRLFVIKNYLFDFPLVSLKIIKSLLVEWLKIIFFEKEKIKKQKMIIKGIYDFFKNKTGKLNE